MKLKKFIDADGVVWKETGDMSESPTGECLQEYVSEVSIWTSDPASMGWTPVVDIKNPAVYSEKFGFKIGPWNHRFYFCERHKGQNPNKTQFVRLPDIEAKPRNENSTIPRKCDMCTQEEEEES